MEKHKYDNCVIKNLNDDFAKNMIQWWKDQGVNTCDNKGYNTEENSNNWCYYGLHNGVFDSFTLDKVNEFNLKIIELPEDPIFELGEKVLVRTKKSIKPVERIYLFTKDNLHYCVASDPKKCFVNYNTFTVMPYTFIEKLPILTEKELKIRELEDRVNELQKTIKELKDSLK